MSANEFNAVVANHRPVDPPRAAAGIIVGENLAGFNADTVQAVLEIEDELTQLQLHIENQEWQAAFERLQMYPDEIMPTYSQGGNGRALTALHLACEGGECPIPLLTAIIAKRPEVAAMVDKDGNTALHFAASGQYSYNAEAIACLLVAYPQAALMQETLERNTPLHLLLLLGGDVNLISVQLLLDVSYSKIAGLPRSCIPLKDIRGSDLTTSVLIAANFPPIVTQVIQQMAINDPFSFPRFLQPFLHLQAPTIVDSVPQLMENQPALLTIQECKQQTPLHSACARGLDTGVFRLLTNESRYPGAHEATRMKDHRERYPLFYAGCYGVPRDAIKLLFDLNPEAIRHVESFKLLTVHSTYISPVHNLEDRKIELKGKRPNPLLPIDGFFVRETALRLWRMYDFLLRLTYHVSYQDPPPGCSHWRVVHAAASIQSPPQFIRSAVHLFPWQLKERDEHGYLPLHLAAMCQRPGGVDESHYWLSKDINHKTLSSKLLPENRAEDNPITILVEAYPGAARAMDKDLRLPLHWAIETDKQWNEGIQSLVKAAPLALSTRDGLYHMYPFMLAGVAGNLDLTFELLLGNPMVVLSGVGMVQEAEQPCSHESKRLKQEK
jgi:ankyrin repeat protein